MEFNLEWWEWMLLILLTIVLWILCAFAKTLNKTARIVGDYVEISKVSPLLEMQNQYFSYYLHGVGQYPNLSNGIRFYEGTKGNYHSIKIHKDDVEELVRRIREHRSGD